MHILKAAAQTLWGGPMVAAMLAVGLFLTLYLGAFQFRHPVLILRKTIGSLRLRRGTQEAGMTPLQSVCTSLAATVGTGNIAGVATAIVLGGAGAVFWMWVAALLGMATAFGENVLGMRYRKQLPQGGYEGGAMYYMARGLGMPRLGRVYALLCLASALGIGCLVQANSIAVGMLGEFHVPVRTSSFVLAGITGIVIFGGAERIGRVTEKLVPAMVALYLLAGLFCLVRRAYALPEALALIFQSALSPRAVAGGSIYAALRYGVSRGVLSNEAGLGSSVMAHTSATGVTAAQQGFWSVMETGIDTLLVCTLTALVILTSGLSASGLTGAALTAKAFSGSLGSAGGKLVAVCLVLFAFSTILGWGHFGACAARYCFGVRAVPILRMLMIFGVFVGGSMEVDAVWLLADVCNGLMAIPNLTALMLLRSEIRQVLQAALCEA